MDEDDHHTNQTEHHQQQGLLMGSAPGAMEFGEKILFQLAVFATVNLMDDAAMLAFIFC
jgi:hypothetical protein